MATITSPAINIAESLLYSDADVLTNQIQEICLLLILCMCVWAEDFSGVFTSDNISSRMMVLGALCPFSVSGFRAFSGSLTSRMLLGPSDLP